MFDTLEKLLNDHLGDKDVDHQFFLAHFPIYSTGSTDLHEYDLD